MSTGSGTKCYFISKLGKFLLDFTLTQYLSPRANGLVRQGSPLYVFRICTAKCDNAN